MKRDITQCLSASPSAVGSEIRRDALPPPPRNRADVDDLLSLAGVRSDAFADAEHHLSDVVERLSRVGATATELGEVGQAYIRALGRVSAAEADVIAAITSARAAAGDDGDSTALVHAALDLGRKTFELLHGTMLRRALGYAQAAGAAPGGRTTAVAHVDVVGSTTLLSSWSTEDILRLVDGLFASGQKAITGRRVAATKYAGDGVFFAGLDAVDVAHAALDCIESLRRSFGLTARGGLAFGSVVHRAGDVFGLPVNMCHALTKRANPNTLLAAPSAADQIPREMQVSRRSIDVPGLSTSVTAVEIRGCSQP